MKIYFHVLRISVQIWAKSYTMAQNGKYGSQKIVQIVSIEFQL